MSQRSRTGNRKLMQELNISLVMDTIRRKGPISQADIARAIPLSGGTVTNIAKMLKQRGIVREVGVERSSGGRKPVLLDFDAEALHVLSATFFADEISVAVLDLAGNMKKREVIASDLKRGQNAVFERFSRAADGLVDSLKVRKERIAGLGASFEGILDYQKGVVILSNRFGWRDVPVRDLLAASCGLRIFVEGDGRAMALGEHEWGAGKGTTNMICVDVDSGIGSAAVLDGALYHGAASMEGEMGHSPVLRDGPLCECGKRGCLEAVASGRAFVRALRARPGKMEEIGLGAAQEPVPERVIARRAFEAAERGDCWVLGVVEEMGEHLGRAVAGLINYADPELVVLTGYMIYESGDLLCGVIERTARAHMLAGDSRAVGIRKGLLGEDAGLMGAASLVYRDLFRSPLAYL